MWDQCLNVFHGFSREVNPVSRLVELLTDLQELTNKVNKLHQVKISTASVSAKVTARNTGHYY